MRKEKYGGIMVLFAIVLAELMSFQLFVDMQFQSINEAIMENPSAAGENIFKRFDASQSDANTLALGEKVTVIDENQLLGKPATSSTPLQEAQIKQVLSSFAGTERLLIAIQNWSILDHGQEISFSRLHTRWYLQLLSWAREVLPQTNLGLVIPAGDLERSGLTLLTPVIKASDAFYPAFDDSVSERQFDSQLNTLADAIEVARRFLKPVYFVLRYQDTTKNKQNFDAMLKKQCQFVREHADGLVRWSTAEEKMQDRVRIVATEDCFK